MLDAGCGTLSWVHCVVERSERFGKRRGCLPWCTGHCPVPTRIDVHHTGNGRTYSYPPFDFWFNWRRPGPARSVARTGGTFAEFGGTHCTFWTTQADKSRCGFATELPACLFWTGDAREGRLRCNFVAGLGTSPEEIAPPRPDSLPTYRRALAEPAPWNFMCAGPRSKTSSNLWRELHRFPRIGARAKPSLSAVVVELQCARALFAAAPRCKCPHSGVGFIACAKPEAY